jgi:hypothetical protein
LTVDPKNEKIEEQPQKSNLAQASMENQANKSHFFLAKQTGRIAQKLLLKSNLPNPAERQSGSKLNEKWRAINAEQ